jgi:anaerobic selenocysteine-containing dehydrogenase/Fe-S-cluster-containing dehydrogenase component
MDRRTFLKITGLGSAAVAAGCTSNPEKNLFTLVKAPDDMVTGVATWYASTCRECPAGCGILAKNREGRVIKLEGNPLHPVNRGKLCARGQAALQGLYNPDRIVTPMRRTEKGLEPIAAAEAESLIRQRLEKAAAKGAGNVAMVTEVTGDTLLNLFRSVLDRYNSPSLRIYEPFAFESLKYAYQQVFGSPQLPGYRLDRADMLISFGADFVETWLSPVEYARKFKAMHAVEGGKKGYFAHISPYQSLTAANADHWLACRPGSELSIALLLLQNVIISRKARRLSTTFREEITRLTEAVTLESVSRDTDIPEEQLKGLLSRFKKASRPLVLGGCTASQGAVDAALDLVTVILNTIDDPTLSLIDFDQRHRVEIADSRASMETFWTRALASPPDLLMLHNVNPLYTASKDGNAAKALGAKDTFVVAFSCFMDETTAAADLIVPIQHPLESWDIYESKQATKAMLQPVLGKINQVPFIGDLFLKLLPRDQQPAGDYRQYLIGKSVDQGLITSDADWIKLMQDGGRFVADRQATKPLLKLDQKLATTLVRSVKGATGPDADAMSLCLAPSIHYFDGRGANRPWLLETPDPISQVSWQTLAWVHPDVMAANRWADGDRVTVQTQYGEIQLPAVAYSGLHPKAIVIPMGQGHTQLGRYAQGQGVNPVDVMGAQVSSQSGSPVYRAAVQSITRAGKREILAHTSGSLDQYDRKIALTIPLEAATEARKEGKAGLTMSDFPLTLPLPEGYAHHRDIYPAHEHDTYRWGMVVDLDRCIGCSACVAACYAENNIGIAGQKQIAKGREMAWMSIQRYNAQHDPAKSVFLPMMCQQCDNAPCEAVCPVYAPHHSKEGLNNQIYNRCIGTRFCAQNCPYKVRRFNWYAWKWPEPLQMQLNPGVTVRTKGVMEKCSFCIQRIKVAHGDAKNESRDIRDGEVVPACVQTCPTNALYFGNLMDPESMVRKLVSDPRAYQVMGYLNVKPAVIYLKKVVQTI